MNVPNLETKARENQVFEAVLAQLEAGMELARREDIVGGLLLAKISSLPDHIIAYLAEHAYSCAIGVGCGKVRNRLLTFALTLLS